MTGFENNDDTTRTQVLPVTPPDAGERVPEGGSVLDTLPVKPQERYRFIRSIGFGGMKGVLLVHDADTGRDVAMAIMPDFRERPLRDIERFVHEAKLTARLEHPNIVPVHDIGIDHSGSPYFTMKYLRGQSLSSLLRKIQKGDPDTVAHYGLVRLLHIFTRVCHAIEFAHSQGICHLDLKPENINIGEYGEVLVLDWGLARPFNSLEPQLPPDENGNVKKQVSGTPGYMSPEQIRNTPEYPVDERSDVFALGGILYAMLTLSNPLAKLPVDEIFRRTVTGDIPAPSEIAAVDRHIPAALDAICLKAMAPVANQRYRHVHELREDIFAFQSGYVPKAENASALKHAGMFISRNGIILLLLLSLTLAAALVVVMLSN